MQQSDNPNENHENIPQPLGENHPPAEKEGSAISQPGKSSPGKKKKLFWWLVGLLVGIGVVAVVAVIAAVFLFSNRVFSKPGKSTPTMLAAVQETPLLATATLTATALPTGTATETISPTMTF